IYIGAVPASKNCDGSLLHIRQQKGPRELLGLVSGIAVIRTSGTLFCLPHLSKLEETACQYARGDQNQDLSLQPIERREEFIRTCLTRAVARPNDNPELHSDSLAQAHRDP